jgi:hypothetical protein
VPFARSPATEWAARFSPDGRYVAYMSNDSGRFELPHRLFDAGAIGASLWNFSPLFASYDPMPDGRGFVVARRAAGPPPSLVLVEAWAAEMTRKH